MLETMNGMGIGKVRNSIQNKTEYDENQMDSNNRNKIPFTWSQLMNRFDLIYSL